MSERLFTSESVSEGHPDKVCDQISDSILDAAIEQDKSSRVACEVLVKDNLVVVAGEITTNAEIDYESLAKSVISDIGYNDSSMQFNSKNLKIYVNPKLTKQIGQRSPLDMLSNDAAIDILFWFISFSAFSFFFSILCPKAR